MVSHPAAAFPFWKVELRGSDPVKLVASCFSAWSAIQRQPPLEGGPRGSDRVISLLASCFSAVGELSLSTVNLLASCFSAVGELFLSTVNLNIFVGELFLSTSTSWRAVSLRPASCFSARSTSWQFSRSNPHLSLHITAVVWGSLVGPTHTCHYTSPAVVRGSLCSQGPTRTCHYTSPRLCGAASKVPPTPVITHHQRLCGAAHVVTRLLGSRSNPHAVWGSLYGQSSSSHCFPFKVPE